MILTVDVGNITIRFGCVQDRNIICTFDLEMNKNKTKHEYAVLMERIMTLQGVSPGDVEGAIISSVVPPLTAIISEAVRLLTGKTPLIVGAGVKTGLNIGIDDPSQLGADLVAAAAAALEGHKPPVIIVDMGTATTITVIDKNLRVLGGAIMPGVGVAMESLSDSTSLLPLVSLEAPRKFIGSNTIDCMKSGLVFGNAAAIDGMIDRMEEQLGERAQIVATGYCAQPIIKHCRREMSRDDNLTLKGLALIWEKNKRSRK